MRVWAAGMVLLVGLVMVVPRHPDAPAHLRVRGDSLQYVAMIEGGAVEAPYGYRIGVPAVARLLPVPPLVALHLITLVSLWAGLGVLLHALRAAGFGWASSLGALFCLSASPAQLNGLHNPFLTDGAGWLVLCLSVLAVVQGRFALFAGAVLLGTTVREASLFVAPAWLALQPRRLRAWMVPVGGVALWLALRGWVGPLPEVPPESRSLLRRVGDAAVTWNVFWVLGAVGLGGIGGPLRARLGWLAALLLGGAVVASTFATDTGRMFAVLGPVLVFGVAWCLEQLPRLGPVLVGVTAACSVVWVPMIFNLDERMSPAWRPWRAGALVALTTVGAACLWALWRARQAGRLTPGGRQGAVF